MATRELDVRPLAPAARHAGIFQTFAALAEGESFVLVNDHNPKPLLYQFQVEHAGTFNWSVLESGPERWRVEIQRRPTGDGAERGVAEYLQWDHERLDGVLQTFHSHVRSGAWSAAEERFGVFRTGLERHIRMEEEILFPVFEQSSPMSGCGPTTVMRSEHVNIKEILAQVVTDTAGRSESGIARALDALAVVLGGHNMKEENILYPMCDEVLGSAGADGVVRKLQAL